jgi:hypothetical protein
MGERADAGEVEERLAGGHTGGAVRAGDTVRRPAGAWTPAVHALLSYLGRAGFHGSPRPLGIDGRGREILTFLVGETVGDALPWPAWVHAEETLVQVARWLRGYHAAVTGFVPPAGAVWRMGGQWRPGLIIGHNDAAPYNAVWRAGRLVGFIDWDMAGPVPPEWDLAYVAFSWVPLHARHVAEREGFTAFGARADRLRLLLDEYGWREPVSAFLGVVAERVSAHIAGLRSLAAAGDPLFIHIVERGAIQDMETALAGLAEIG